MGIALPKFAIPESASSQPAHTSAVTMWLRSNLARQITTCALVIAPCLLALECEAGAQECIRGLCSRDLRLVLCPLRWKKLSVTKHIMLIVCRLHRNEYSRLCFSRTFKPKRGHQSLPFHRQAFTGLNVSAPDIFDSKLPPYEPELNTSYQHWRQLLVLART